MLCELSEEVLDKDLDNKTLGRFYNEYRRLENLLSPKEIKNIRQKYNLSQNAFSKFLGFEERAVTRYENGTIQDVYHDSIIRQFNKQYLKPSYLIKIARL